MIKTSFEEEILKYALAEENSDRFASLLNEILPRFTSWIWGENTIYRRKFNEWQRSGFNLMPNHYYSPIPDINQLSDEIYQNESELVGISLNDANQLKFLENICIQYLGEYSSFPEDKTENRHEYYFKNGVFQHIDAEILHCMIRHHKPKRMIEIGSGFSTLVSAAACEVNRKEHAGACEFYAIEPYPDEMLSGEIPGLSRLVKTRLQDVDMEIFLTLDKGDILFIDSSHILKIGGDVQYEYLEILPRLKPGVIVHVHDIFLPGEYPRNWIEEEHVFWNEQYLLQAFLSFNESYEVLWAGCYMHRKFSEKLAEIFPGYSANSCLPGSFWMLRTK